MELATGFVAQALFRYNYTMSVRWDTRILRVLAVLLPVAFWVGVLVFRNLVFRETRTLAGDIVALAAIGVGAALFSAWIFGIVDEREAEIQQRSQQLTALHDAAVTLTTELDLPAVLQKVVQLARELVHAQYGALGVLADDGRYIEQFITSGITPEQRKKLGALPRGHGLLGVLIHEGKPIRIPNIAEDPRSVGFPPNHPPMRTLLGVPIRSKGRVIGDLYMTDKVAPDGSPATVFTAQDEQVLEMFATQAAIAIENAQLYRQKQQLAVLQERERFGMDLHDGVIQSIYAVGLMLEEAEHGLEQDPREAHTHVEQAKQRLNEVIRDIRSYILDLRPQRFQGRDLPRGLEELVREFRANTFLTVNLDCAPLEANLLTPEQTVEILHIAQEALTNIRKHARATTVDIDLVRDAEAVELDIQDNGSGIEPARADGGSGQGLKNMRERARSLGGNLEIKPGADGGTRVRFRLATG